MPLKPVTCSTGSTWTVIFFLKQATSGPASLRIKAVWDAVNICSVRGEPLFENPCQCQWINDGPAKTCSRYSPNLHINEIFEFTELKTKTAGENAEFEFDPYKWNPSLGNDRSFGLVLIYTEFIFPGLSGAFLTAATCSDGSLCT